MSKKIEKCTQCGSSEILKYRHKIRCKNCGLVSNSDVDEGPTEDELDNFFNNVIDQKKIKKN